MSKIQPTPAGRLLSLDYLRGYFVIIIIVDHLWKYPSLWALVSGEAKLWVTAAEGFVMISGFLIGYIRGFKGLKLPFSDIARKLLWRAAMLYFWMVIVSMGYIMLEWSKLVPNMPFTPISTGNYTSHLDAFTQFALGGQPHMWIHFLYLYAIFLLLAIGAVFMLRRRQPWLLVITTLLTYLLGLIFDEEWMKWQIIFFLPSIVGFYFDQVRTWWSARAQTMQAQLRSGLWGVSGVLLFLSVMAAFAPWSLPTAFVDWTNAAFAIEGFSPLRVIVAGLWFVSLAFLFERIAPWLQKYTYGVLEYFGTHSLTAYIAHGFMICLVNYIFTFAVPEALAIPYNTLLGFTTIMATYFFIRLPGIRRVIPK